jgi:type II secretory pathway component GspD/PulD (secretin)
VQRWANAGWSAVALAIVGLVSPAAAQSPLPDLSVSRLELGNAQGGQPSLLAVSRPGVPSPLDGPQKISVTFARPTPVSDVLRLLVRTTPFSVVTDASVGTTFSGELRDLTVRQALEAVLFAASLDYTVSGRVVQVFPRRAETRLFEVDLVAGRADQGRDVFTEIGAGVAALLSEGGRSHVDRRAGLVQVTDFADRLDQVALYLESVHLRAARQVRLEARVLEVRLEGARGVDWRALGGSQGSGAGVIVRDLDALVRALGGPDRAAVVQTASFVATNNEPAVVRFGGRGAAGESTLALAVTAQVGADSVVQLNVAPSLSRARGGGASSGEAGTIVRVREGESVMLSGSMVDGLAAAGTELVLLVTPTIVAPAAGVR